jgi:hypothetical protein
MRRKLFAVIVGGAIAGASSALVAMAAFTDHPATAGDQQPSTLLESANGSGSGDLATEPSSAAQTGGGAQAGAAQSGQSGSVAGRTQPGGGVALVHGVTPLPAPAAGQTGSGGDPWQTVVGVPSAPSASPPASPSASSTPPGLPGLPSLPSVPTATPSPGVTAHATPTPTPAGGTTVTVQVPPLPLPLPTLQPVCVLLICIKP